MTATGFRSTPPWPLGQLGRAAGVAGGPLLHAVQNGVESVREQAMRAIAKIQPPETAEAFAAGLKDACGDVRMLASAGWMNAAAIAEQAIPALVEALGDPEVRVRANCAHALARLDTIPAAAIPLLVECTLDADDGLRMNAAMALISGPDRHGGGGDAAPGRGLELARAFDRRELASLRGIEQPERGRCPSRGPGRPSAASPRGGARAAGVPRCIGCGACARLDEW